MRRRIVIISGAPGAGKTSIAAPLAGELGLPLFAKDPIKETIHDAAAEPGPVTMAWSRRLGAASMELLWRLAEDAPACVLEANFHPRHERSRTMLKALSQDGVLVEVHCDTPLDEARRRFFERRDAGLRHAVHLDDFPPEAWDEFEGPVGLGPVVELDTTRPVDIRRTAALVRELLASGGVMP